MRTIMIASTALLLSTMPAHAQLLGGGLGGALGGTLGGTVNGTLGGAGSIGSTVDSVRSGTTGTLRGAGSTSGSQHVNRRTGAVHADRSASASGSGALDTVAGTPAHMVGGNVAGSAGGSGSGAVDGRLIGTDAVRGAVAGVRNGAAGAASHARGTVRNAAGGLGNLAGSGSAAGSGSGSAAGTLGSLDGAASGSGNGGFQVTRGMPVLGPDGQRIGKVQRLVTNRSGEIEQMLVKVGDRSALLPAANFTASGNAVTSAMSAAQIEQMGAKGSASQAQGSTAAATTRSAK
ncbi:MAG: hypothetical protein KGM17_12880 [Sphingomonadales bacterium]|nr:hypothetical protein [Sphingomonadales bacterium]